MNISYDKYKQEISNFYRFGYRTCFKWVIETIKSESENIDELIKKLHEKYNKHPCIEKILIEEK